MTRENGVRLLRKIGQDARGATAVEYGLILGLIFVAIIGAVQGLATKTIGMWEYVNTQVGNT